MPLSVRFDDQWWDVSVGRDAQSVPLAPVWLVRFEQGEQQQKLLCQVQGDKRFGWDVVVSGSVRGLRLVEGFKTRWQAIEYAIVVRSDINVVESEYE